MTPSERSGAGRRGLTRFQMIRYSIYSLLTVNLLYYLWEDLIAFRYVPRGAPLAQILENFAITIDYVAWMVLRQLQGQAGQSLPVTLGRPPPGLVPGVQVRQLNRKDRRLEAVHAGVEALEEMAVFGQPAVVGQHPYPLV